jgi:hypothetical protein
MCPVRECDGRDVPGLVDGAVPAKAAVIDDLVMVVEAPVGEPVLADELPDVLHHVPLWAFRRQGQKSAVWWQREVA